MVDEEQGTEQPDRTRVFPNIEELLAHIETTEGVNFEKQPVYMTRVYETAGSVFRDSTALNHRRRGLSRGYRVNLGEEGRDDNVLDVTLDRTTAGEYVLRAYLHPDQDEGPYVGIGIGVAISDTPKGSNDTRLEDQRTEDVARIMNNALQTGYNAFKAESIAQARLPYHIEV